MLNMYSGVIVDSVEVVMPLLDPWKRGVGSSWLVWASIAVAVVVGTVVGVSSLGAGTHASSGLVALTWIEYILCDM